MTGDLWRAPEGGQSGTGDFVAPGERALTGAQLREADPTPRFRIGEIAERTGLSMRSIRYYEESGLVTPAGRTEGGFRMYSETDVQRLGFTPADLRLAAEGEEGLHLRLDAPDRAADRAAIDPVEEAEELLRDVAAVVEQQDQQVILQAADLPGAAGLRLAAFGRVPRAAQPRQHLIEGGDADAGEAVEAGTAAQPRGGERVRQGGGPFVAKEADESYRVAVWEARVSAGLPTAGSGLPQQV